MQVIFIKMTQGKCQSLKKRSLQVIEWVLCDPQWQWWSMSQIQRIIVGKFALMQRSAATVNCFKWFALKLSCCNLHLYPAIPVKGMHEKCGVMAIIILTSTLSWSTLLLFAHYGISIKAAVEWLFPNDNGLKLISTTYGALIMISNGPLRKWPRWRGPLLTLLLRHGAPPTCLVTRSLRPGVWFEIKS